MPRDRVKIRRQILAARDALSRDEQHSRSRTLAENLWSAGLLRYAKTLFIYVDFRSEVETVPLIRQCLRKGMQVAVPLTLPAESRLVPYLITDPDQDLQPGYCSIPEPDPHRLPAVDPHNIDTVILPGSVFDEKGGRLGYGGGFYDRFLANEAPHAKRIGMAFELQIVPSLPLLPHDQLLHHLVTEKKVLHFARHKEKLQNTPRSVQK